MHHGRTAGKGEKKEPPVTRNEKWRGSSSVKLNIEHRAPCTFPSDPSTSQILSANAGAHVVGALLEKVSISSQEPLTYGSGKVQLYAS
mmetsp:Transcript_17888/g.24636  ORF Transcript_17888/g.24636 Transcript_17888/m.24636 type:complete len:88 (+) Transcript_17888:145-408(+)